MSTSFLSVLSEIFGWVYMILWSLSFYPQPLLNWRRKSTEGATIDFPAVNILGFLAYFVSNLAFLYSPVIREQYAARNHGLTPTVQLNDVAFAGHAFVVCSIILTQFWPRIWGFDKEGKAGLGTNISMPIKLFTIGCLFGVCGVIVIVAYSQTDDPKSGWAWIDVIYAISFVKLFITLIKYIPQVITNFRNKSTEGWSIGQIIFDFTGGILSLAQLGIDSYLQKSWSGITGNPVKFALGNISIVYDLIFMVQHYWLYRDSRLKAAAKASSEYDPLLENRDN